MSQSWDEVAKRRRSEQTRESRKTLASCGLVCLWGITLVTVSFSFAIYPEYYRDVPVEWIQFYSSIIFLLVILSIAVTILYVILRLHFKMHPVQ